MMELTGRFTEKAMTLTLRRIADQIGVSTGDARLLRLTNNAVFALPAAGMVIRITRSFSLHDRVHKVARLGAWFDEVSAPTIRLATGIPQPVEADGLLATVWRYVPPTDPAPAAEDLGHVLQRFHTLKPPPFPLPAWDPVDDARRRLADAENLSSADRAFLLEWCDRLDAAAADLNARRGGHLVHGDAHVGNLLRDVDGTVLLGDFDPTCIGPWQVDLVAVAVGEIRFGRIGAHQRLTASYGYDVTTDPDWAILREARELKMVVAAVPLLASAPGVAHEYTIRLRSIIANDPHARWTPFAAITTPPSTHR